jgi:hypothetical protein
MLSTDSMLLAEDLQKRDVESAESAANHIRTAAGYVSIV